MRAVFLALLVLISLSSLRCGAQELSWSVLLRQIRSSYPDVRQLSTDSLALWLDDAEAPQPLLLDVRTAAEYRVSHLSGAHRIDPDATIFPDLADLPPDTPIVTYCSVGYRSSETARRLQDAGFTRVVNLEGSLFLWANEGRPVFRDGKTVRQVHPFDARWGLLLGPDLRTYTP